MQTELEENSEVIVDIKRLGINGEGIAYYKRLAIFIKNAIPGEGVNVRITKMLDKMAFGDVIEFKHTSNSRVEVKCPYYEVCGGCQTLHINYQKMLEFKRESIIEAISRYTKLNYKSFEIKKTYGMDNQYGYRYKSQLQASMDEDNNLILGLINPVNHELVNIDNCLNHTDLINETNKKIVKILNDNKITAFDKETQKGDIRNVVVRQSHFTNEIQVTFITAYKRLDLKNVSKEVMNLDNVVSVAYSYHDLKEEGSIFTSPSVILNGKDTIVENIGRFKFELSPETFFQLNPVQTEHLYDFIVKASKLTHQETVLDLYCGAGTIGIYMAKLSKQIIGIEYNASAVENAIKNAKDNRIRNAKYYQGSVDKVLPELLKDNINIDVVVCDPPRVGLGKDVCETLLKYAFKRIVYTSCNPSTLAKDIDILSSIYQVKYIQPVDMFPNTSHTESVTLLELKK